MKRIRGKYLCYNQKEIIINKFHWVLTFSAQKSKLLRQYALNIQHWSPRWGQVRNQLFNMLVLPTPEGFNQANLRRSTITEEMQWKHFKHHSTGRFILYLQPISKLTSQCEIRTLWPKLTTNNRVLTYNCFQRSHKFWGGGTNTFRSWSSVILAWYLHSSLRTLFQSDIHILIYKHLEIVNSWTVSFSYLRIASHQRIN